MATPATKTKTGKTTSKTRRKLQAVPTPADAPDPRGDTTLTEEALAAWTEGQRKCRARKRHYWRPFTVREHRTYFDVVEQCADCRNRHAADFIKTAHGVRRVTKWQPIYRDGYLLPKGAAPLDEDLYDELTASDILSRRIIDATAEDEEACEHGQGNHHPHLV